MHVSGVVLRTQTGPQAELVARLEAHPWLEVFERDPDRGLLVVTVEAETAHGLVDQAEVLRRLPGVADVRPVFHGFTHDAADLRPDPERKTNPLAEESAR